MGRATRKKHMGAVVPAALSTAQMRRTPVYSNCRAFSIGFLRVGIWERCDCSQRIREVHASRGRTSEPAPATISLFLRGRCKELILLRIVGILSTIVLLESGSNRGIFPCLSVAIQGQDREAEKAGGFPPKLRSLPPRHPQSHCARGIKQAPDSRGLFL